MSSSLAWISSLLASTLGFPLVRLCWCFVGLLRNEYVILAEFLAVLACYAWPDANEANEGPKLGVIIPCKRLCGIPRANVTTTDVLIFEDLRYIAMSEAFIG